MSYLLSHLYNGPSLPFLTKRRHYFLQRKSDTTLAGSARFAEGGPDAAFQAATKRQNVKIEAFSFGERQRE